MCHQDDKTGSRSGSGFFHGFTGRQNNRFQTPASARIRVSPLVQRRQLPFVLRRPVHAGPRRRPENDRPAFFFHRFRPLQRLVVHPPAPLHRFHQPAVRGIDPPPQPAHVAAGLFPVAGFPGEHDDMEFVAVAHRFADGDRIADAAVEQRAASDLDGRRQKRQAARRPDVVHEPPRRTLFMLFPVNGFPGYRIGGHDPEPRRVAVESVVVERHEPVRQFVENKVHAEQAPLSQQVAHGQIARMVHVADGHRPVAPSLSRQMRRGRAFPRGHGDDVRKADALIQKILQHTGGVDAAHAASFQHKTDLHVSRLPSFHIVADTFRLRRFSASIIVAPLPDKKAPAERMPGCPPDSRFAKMGTANLRTGAIA